MRRGLRASRWFALAVGALVFVGVVGTVAGVVALEQLSSARAALADRLDPASIQAETLLAAMVDQETGVRGYALSGDDRFLGPYRTGRPATAAALARLQALDVPEIRADVRAVAAAARAWETQYAQPTVARVTTDPTAAGRPAAALAGKARFDAFRAAVRHLESRLGPLRADARARLDRSAHTTLLWIIGIGIDPAYAERIFVIFQRLHPRSVYEAPASASPCAARSSNTTADGCGSPPPTATPAPASASLCPPVTPPSDSQPIAVLLVEDDPGDVVLIQEAFEHNKVRNRLHVVGDGVEAMEFLRNGGERPDLVLLDLNLPRRSSARSTSSSSPSSSSRLTRRQVKNGVRRKGAAGLAHFLRDW